MENKKTIYMRQIMQLLMALIVLMPSALRASVLSTEVNDSVKGAKAAVETKTTRTVTGTVYDAATNTPLPGVRVQGTGHDKVTTMTNGQGQYKLEIPSYVTLLSFSTPEYQLLQAPVYNDDVINVRLYSDKFSDIYSADIKALEHNGFKKDVSPSLSIDGDIQKKLGADVRSTTRSGTLAIGNAMLIRGINSIKANTQPLVVVDGIIWNTQEESATPLHMGIYNNIIASIDVEDIDEVKVMKNGAAIYGARAANGVIIINTKRGKSLATRITANIYGGVTTIPSTMKMLNAEEYRLYANDIVGTMPNISPNTTYDFLNASPSFVGYNKYHNNTNWEDYVYSKAFSQNYKLNVEGGDEIAMYNFSFGYTQADSPLEGNNMNRMNVRLNSTISLTEKFYTRFDISYSRVARELLDDGIREDLSAFPITSTGYLAKIKSPFLSPYAYSNLGLISTNYDTADRFAHQVVFDNGNSHPNSSLYNPMTILDKGAGAYKNEMEYTNLGITVAPEYRWEDFTLTETFNYTLHRLNEVYFLPYASPDASSADFYVESADRTFRNYAASLFGREAAITIDTRLAWDKRFGAHDFDVFGGFRYTNYDFDSNSIGGANTGNDNTYQVSASLDALTTSGTDDVWTNLSWYLSADYSYKTRYFLQFASSLETSSRFGKEAKGGLNMCGASWAFFPSLQAAWLVSSENWFKLPAVNMLKLRAGFDITGNDAIDFYASRSYLQAIKFHNQTLGLQLANVENEGIKWETTARFNIGFDATFFDNRLALSFDAYKSKTSDLLVQKQYAFVTGMDKYWSNGGSLENTGFEATLKGRLVNTADFQWELGASIGHYKNKITALDEDLATVSVYGGEVKSMVGQPVGVFWGYKTDGVISSSADAEALGLYLKEGNTVKKFEAGDMKFVDVNKGDNPGLIDENDKTIIGDPNPDFYGNIFTTLSYKNWKLDMVCNYSIGNDVYNYYRQMLESGSNFHNQTTSMRNRWVYDGQITSMPAVKYGDPMGNSRFSDRWIEDGSYLKMKMIKLSYNVPVSYSWLQGLTLWCAAENLFTITGYDGNDPETSVSNNVYYQGVDVGLLPQSASFHFGVKVNL